MLRVYNKPLAETAGVLLLPQFFILTIYGVIDLRNFNYWGFE